MGKRGLYPRHDKARAARDMARGQNEAGFGYARGLSCPPAGVPFGGRIFLRNNFDEVRKGLVVSKSALVRFMSQLREE